MDYGRYGAGDFGEGAAQALDAARGAAREDMSVKRAREWVSAILSRRADPPAEFAQPQIRRLSEAMLVAYGATSNGNLKVVDQVVKNHP